MKIDYTPTKFEKYLKIGSWIATFIFVIFMFSKTAESEQARNIVESSKTEAGRTEYIEQKYGNVIDELEVKN